MSKAFHTAKPIRPHAPLSDWRIDKWLRVSRFLGRDCALGTRLNARD
jgi:hypothetical protein